MGPQSDVKDFRDDDADWQIDAKSEAAWGQAVEAARALVADVDPDDPDTLLLRSIAARIEISALVLAAIEARRTHQEVKRDIFDNSLSQIKMQNRLIETMEKVAGMVESIEQRMGKLETKVAMLVMRTNLDS